MPLRHCPFPPTRFRVPLAPSDRRAPPSSGVATRAAPDHSLDCSSPAKPAFAMPHADADQWRVLPAPIAAPRLRRLPLTQPRPGAPAAQDLRAAALWPCDILPQPTSHLPSAAATHPRVLDGDPPDPPRLTATRPPPCRPPAHSKWTTHTQSPFASWPVRAPAAFPSANARGPESSRDTPACPQVERQLFAGGEP